METVKTPFYKIETPKLVDFIEAIDELEYFTMRQLEQRRKQLRAYYNDLYAGETPLLSFVNVSNAGGYPIIFHAGDDIYGILQNFYGDEIDDHDIELFWSYAREL